MKAAVREELNTFWKTRNPCVVYEQFQDTLGGITIRPEMVEYALIPYNRKDKIFHEGSSWDSRILGSGLIPGGKVNDEARQAVFFTSLNPFGNNPDEERPHGDHTVLQKYITKLTGNTIKMQCIGIKLSRAQDQGLPVWQTESFAIITHDIVPGGDIHRVIIREAHNTKASTQGYAEEQLTCAAAVAAAAAHSQGRRK